MKNRFVLGFAVLLLMGVWGKSYAQPSSAGPEALGDAPVALSGAAEAQGGALSCPASLAGLHSLELPGNPSLRSFPCGLCSDSDCQDARPIRPATTPTDPSFAWGGAVSPLPPRFAALPRAAAVFPRPFAAFQREKAAFLQRLATFPRRLASS
jgi:hypothetical protein